ncbi:MAG: hypothetical protein PHU44_15975 [Syntrophales bacterium]|nr:hypothetical protein [Syntrophales bacterium]MDD5642390.1 hypothetical protein [Syntrophales bacterium]
MQDQAKPNHGATPVRIITLYLACGLLTLLIFLFDLVSPFGVIVAILYIVVVLLSLWVPQKSFTLWVAVLTSILTTIEFFYSPPKGEMWKVIFNRGLAIFAIWATAFLVLQRKITAEKREKAVREREKALEVVKILRGYLPICAACKKIRNDAGYWTQIEAYIREHSEANFTHSICPECAKKLYPEFLPKEDPDSEP